MLWSFQVLIGPSRYWNESPICDKLKHQKRYLEVLFLLRVYWEPPSGHTSVILWCQISFGLLWSLLVTVCNLCVILVVCVILAMPVLGAIWHHNGVNIRQQCHLVGLLWCVAVNLYVSQVNNSVGRPRIACLSHFMYFLFSFLSLYYRPLPYSWHGCLFTKPSLSLTTYRYGHYLYIICL